MKKLHAKRGWIFFVVLALVLVLGKTPVFAASVSDFAGLKAAANRGDSSITITGNIIVTETLEIEKNVTISGDPKNRPKLILADGFSKDQMFKVPEGESLTLNDIILDGKSKGRLINVKGGTVILKMADLQNGSTEPLQKVIKNGKDEQNYSGGAILANEGSTVTIKGGFFVDNNTGSKVLSKDRFAEGGAIKIEDSTLTIDGTSFIDNHLDSSATEGGRQGGAIEATRTNVEIANARFTIFGPCNTGGGIKFEDCSEASVNNSTFMLRARKGVVGVAGGAITSKGSNLTIEKSNFLVGQGTRVSEAGGLIQVVGKGSFNLSDSTLEGAGAWRKAGKYTANTGGAISFYDDCSVTAKITDTTIKNFMVDGNGAGIALSKGNGHSSNVNLTLTNTIIQNASAYTWDGNSYAGGMYIGKGNTVKIDGGKISSQTASYVVGGIYNMGDLEITGGAQIVGNNAYKMVGGIYHEGKRLKLDKVNFSNNKVGDGGKANHMIEGKEKGGINVYAKKDVIITPEATFDGNDVRVFDGKSAILLTGALKNQINVSISEKEKTTTEEKEHLKIFGEDQHRKVGYVVVKGTDGYKPTAEDARKIHYVTNDTTQAVAGPDEHENLGEWDFVVNPQNNIIVFGQRAKVKFDPNGTENAPANIVGKAAEETSEEDFIVYSPDAQIPDMKIPVRSGYRFTGWYLEPAAKDNKSDPGSPSKQTQQAQERPSVLYAPMAMQASMEKKTLVRTLADITGSQAEIAKTLDPYEYTLYAGWEKVIPVQKVWDDENDWYKNRPDSISVKLLVNGNSEKELVLNKENNWAGEFVDIPNDATGTAKYTVQEDPEQIKGYTTGEVEGNDRDGFTVTNSTEFITIEGKKTWVHDGNEGTKPENVKVTLNENGKATDKKETGASWKFENLPKYRNKQEVNYTLTEAPVPNYTSSADGYNFTNTYEKKYKVTYEFVSGTEGKTLPDEVMALLPAEETEKEDGAKVTPKQPTRTSVDTTDGTWTFKGWNPAETTISGADVSFKGTWTLVEKTSDFTVAKVVDKATFEKAGDVLTYTVTVKNTGEKKLENLTISDSLVKLTEDPFALEVGGEKTFTYTYTVTEADVKAKAVNNTATITLGDKSKDDSTKSTLVEKISDFTVTKTVDKATFEKVGDVLTYTVTAKNTGEKDLTGLTISDPKTTFENPTFDLKKGEIKTFTYTYTVTEADVEAKAVNNTATVTHDNDVKSASAESKLKEDKPNPPTKVTTQYVDEQGNRLIPDRAGKQPVVEIKDYTYLRTEESDTLIRHIYKKIQAPTHPSGSVLILPTPGTSEPVPDDGLLNKKDHKAYMFGYPDGNFLPERNMTREEATAMFARLLKDYPRERRNYTIPFKDVAESDWSQQAIGFMLEKGMIQGYEDGSFRPKAAISRAEFAAMAARFDKLVAGGGHSFFDVPAGHWAQGAIDSAAAKGWVTGYPDGSFKPERKITRAEVVNITNKMLDRFADRDFVCSHRSEMIQFKDLTEAHWAYFPIVEATNSHELIRRGGQDELNRAYEKWIAILQKRAAR